MTWYFVLCTLLVSLNSCAMSRWFSMSILGRSFTVSPGSMHCFIGRDATAGNHLTWHHLIFARIHLEQKMRCDFVAWSNISWPPHHLVNSLPWLRISLNNLEPHSGYWDLTPPLRWLPCWGVQDPWSANCLRRTENRVVGPFRQVEISPRGPQQKPVATPGRLARQVPGSGKGCGLEQASRNMWSVTVIDYISLLSVSSLSWSTLLVSVVWVLCNNY